MTGFSTQFFDKKKLSDQIIVLGRKSKIEDRSQIEDKSR
jgi:hypothetical protein